MEAIEFPEQTVVLAKDQPQYSNLPVYMDAEQTISCYRPSWRERLAILFGKPIWLRQMTFGERLQPQLPTLVHPFGGRR